MAGCIQFTIEGLSTRGFYVHMYNWVPHRGERLYCKIGEDGPISAFKDEQIVGNVPIEWSRKYRKWLKAGGKLEAIVHYGHHRVHRTKGEEVPVIYLFTGNSTPLLINTKIAIEEATNQKAKRRKSLKFHDGDQTDTLLQRNVGCLAETLGSQTNQLDFSISGMTIRGFFKTKEKWVPTIGARHECFITETKAVAVKLDENEICGNIPTDTQKLWRRFLKEKGRIEAVIAGTGKENRRKGEEVPVWYIFTGEWSCVLQNLRRYIIEG